MIQSFLLLIVLLNHHLALDPAAGLTPTQSHCFGTLRGKRLRTFTD